MLANTVSILAASLLLETGLLDLRASFQAFALLQIFCGVAWIALVVPKERKAAVMGSP